MNNFVNPILKNKKGVYIVQKNDTLSSIAKAFNTTENLLIKDNFLTGECVLGNCLYIQSFSEIYEVKIEDTLDSISKKCKISIEELKRINKISYIYPTLKLVIR